MSLKNCNRRLVTHFLTAAASGGATAALIGIVNSGNKTLAAMSFIPAAILGLGGASVKLHEDNWGGGVSIPDRIVASMGLGICTTTTAVLGKAMHSSVATDALANHPMSFLGTALSVPFFLLGLTGMVLSAAGTATEDKWPHYENGPEYLASSIAGMVLSASLMLGSVHVGQAPKKAFVPEVPEKPVAEQNLPAAPTLS